MDTVFLRSAMVLFDIIKFFFLSNFISPNLQTKFDAFLSKPDSLTIPQYNLIYGASLR
jgi:hypothetical protein